MDLPVVIPLALVALAVSAVGSLLAPRWDAGVVTGLLAAVWARVNGPVEGRILHTFSETRGFTEADLLSVAALAVAALTFARCGWRAVRGGTAAAHQGP